MTSIKPALLLSTSILIIGCNLVTEKPKVPIEKSAPSIKLSTQVGQLVPVTNLAFSPDGSTLAIGSKENDDCEVKLWHLRSMQSFSFLKGYIANVNSIVFSPDGNTLVSGDQAGTINIWDVNSGKIKSRLKANQTWGENSIAISPDGNSLGFCVGYSIIIWNLKSGKIEQLLKGHKRFIRSIVFSPDGKTLASSSDDVIKLWNYKIGKEIRTITRKSEFDTLVFSQDGGSLLSTQDASSDNIVLRAALGSDNDINIWSVATGKQLDVLHPSGYALCVAVSPDGKLIACGNTSGTIEIWAATPGKKLATFLPSDYVEYLRGKEILTIAISPDSETLASGSNDGTIRLWDIASGSELCSIMSYTDKSWVVIAPDGRFDSSNQENAKFLFWLYTNQQKQRIPIKLSHLSKFFYTPGLLYKIYNRQVLPRVPSIEEILSYPEGSVLTQR
jgi:WD40 repeat protein